MVERYHIESASVSDRGLSEKRPQNEDSYIEMPECGIFAVADGVGGAQAGEVASQMAMEIVGEAFANMDETADAEDVMRISMERANSAIFQMSSELAQLSQMATTVVALHLSGNIATIGHVGDSRLYRLDSNGGFIQETDDHSMVAEEVRAGRMTAEQAENHPSKNIISRALGAEATVEVDLKTTMIEPGTTFLICSDGITRHISDPELSVILGSGEPAYAVCDTLRHLCFERGAEDNLTAVIVRFAPEEVSSVGENDLYTNDSELFADDEPTVASARQNMENAHEQILDNDELLEIDTLEMPFSAAAADEPDIFIIPEVPTINVTHPPIDPVADNADASQPRQIDEPAEKESDGDSDLVASQQESTDEPSRPIDQDFSMFGNPGNDSAETDSEGSGTLGRMAISVGLLLAGAIAGLASYHFLLVPQMPPAPLPQLEMRSANEPLTAFEENRRSLDKDPATALKLYVADPKDAEDYFLLGRAFLLVGQYPDARRAFIESRNKIAAGDVDPSNAKTLENEIAIAMAVTNDTTIQGILRKEVESTKPLANTAANSNANVSR